jgi:CrcB protein
MIVAIAVGLAGSCGAVARYLTDGLVQDRTTGAFPFGTLTVNGMFWYHGLTVAPRAIVGDGFCGGLTTWSTASFETVRLAEEGMAATALVNALGGLAVSVAAAALGIVIVALI